MKNLIIAILGLIIITACGPKTVNEYGLNRNVESFTVKAYEVVSKFGKYTKGEINTNYNYRDVNCIYEFTEEGYLKSKSELDIYDGEFTGDIDGKDIYNYDADGRMVSEYSYSSSGDLIYYRTYEYDNNGNCITVKFFDDDNSLSCTHTNIYDDNNKIIKHIHNDEPDMLIDEMWECDYEMTYVYDDNGNVIKHIIHNFKTISQEESTYEEEVHNNIIETIETNEYGLASRITSGIDSYTFEYTYDRYAGNWISMTIYKNSIPVSIIEREITY